MQRRDFLKYTSALAFSGMCPSIFANDNSNLSKRRLILIELKGGNDGLNTLIPYKDQIYKDIREQIQIKKDNYRIIDDSLGIALNSELEFFDQNNKLRSDVAILHSVGSPKVNKSHFTGIKFWENGSTNLTKQGWIARALDGNKKLTKGTITQGVVIGDKILGPFTRTTSNVLIVDDLKRMLKKDNIERFEHEDARGNHNLRHVFDTETSIRKQLEEFSKNIGDLNSIKGTGFEKDVETLIKITSVFPQIPAFKLSLGGFDTHRSQSATHRKLLAKLNTGLKGLVDGLRKHNLYESTLIMTYSEFGRRPKQNSSGGTDHGEANCHFLLGGKVKGGKIYYGKNANLQAGKGGYDLSNMHKDAKNNLEYKIDFRDVYQEILTDWWKVKGLDKYAEVGYDFKEQNKLYFLKA